MAVNTCLSKANAYIYDSEEDYVSKLPYKKLVGVLLWCSLIFCPDLSYAVNQVAKFNNNPSILLYAYQYKDWGILYVPWTIV